MRGLKTLQVAVMALLSVASVVHARSSEPIGRISGNLGGTSLEGASARRKAIIGGPVYDQDVIRTGPADAASVLLNERVVMRVSTNTVVRLAKGKGRTDFKLERGNVQVFIGERLHRDPVAVQDEGGTIEAIGTVIVAGYEPATKEGFYACEDSSATVRPTNGEPVTVRANQQARIRAGALMPVENLDRNLLRQRIGGIMQLRAQGSQRAAKVSQSRTERVYLQEAVAAMVSAQAANLPSSLPPPGLSDVLLGRCADLDEATDPLLAMYRQDPASLPTDVHAVPVSPHQPLTLKIDQLAGNSYDLTVDLRSCIQSNRDVFLREQITSLTIQVEVPNVIRMDLTKQGGISETVSANVLSADGTFLFSLELTQQETKKLQLLAVPQAEFKPPPEKLKTPRAQKAGITKSRKR